MVGFFPDEIPFSGVITRARNGVLIFGNFHKITRERSW